MSENFYAWLLRLYPSHFREAYGEQALQLFRDRARDEQGFVKKLRLWLDLAADLAISLPREYRHARQPLVATSTQRLDAIPLFAVLGGQAPRPSALLSGGVLSILILISVSILLNHVGLLRSIRGSASQQADSAPSKQRHRVAGAFGHGETAGTPATQQPAAAAVSSGGSKSDSKANNGTGDMSQDFKLDAVERQFVIRAVSANLSQYYIDRNAAQKTADALLAKEKSGDYDHVTDGEVFADLLTAQMRQVSQDRHLIVDFNKIGAPGPAPRSAAEAFTRYRQAMKRQNCTFEKVEILPHNVGYLKLNSFPDVSICKPTAVAAMASLSRTDAIIFDLRDNSGGFPNMVRMISSYLFDHPEYLYNPRESPTEQSWTSPVPGSKLTNKPVFILTSQTTLSGAEQFTYDLKMLKRATIVGQTTGGAAHAGVYYRIDDHFGMGIPEVKAINPFSKTDWEGSGIEPDVNVNAADALLTAQHLAVNRIKVGKGHLP